MARKKSLYFWQPRIGISVQARIVDDEGKQRRGKIINSANHCRALLNSGLSRTLQELLTRPRKVPVLDWRGKEVERVVGYDIVGNLDIQEDDDFAELRIAMDSLVPQQRGVYTENIRRGPIPLARIKDFHYLADLLCGTFGVLLDPRENARVPDLPRPSSLSAKKVANLEYPVSGPEILLSPALTALLIGQLRLAALLAANGEAKAIAAVVKRAAVRKAVRTHDRQACIDFLRKAEKWVLRSEYGEWAFTAKNPARYRNLLKYFRKGGTAPALVGRSVANNWRMKQFADRNFHNKGFQDYMSRTGDKRLVAYKEK